MAPLRGPTGEIIPEEEYRDYLVKWEKESVGMHGTGYRGLRAILWSTIDKHIMRIISDRLSGEYYVSDIILDVKVILSCLKNLKEI